MALGWIDSHDNVSSRAGGAGHGAKRYQQLQLMEAEEEIE